MYTFEPHERLEVAQHVARTDGGELGRLGIVSLVEHVVESLDVVEYEIGLVVEHDVVAG